MKFSLLFIVSSFGIIKGEDAVVQQMGSKDFIGNYSRNGFIAAFGDINSDKQTDVYVISDDGKKVLIFLGSQVSPSLNLHQTIDVDLSATSVVSTDFNADGITDLLITYKTDNEAYIFDIYWGVENGKINDKNPYKSRENLYDEPLLLDANADMISDLFVVYKNKTRGFLLGQKGESTKWDFSVRGFSLKEELPLLITHSPHSHAFIDLTGEGSADLFVTSDDKDGSRVFEIWQGSTTGLVLAQEIPTATSDLFENRRVGPTTFGDFNADGKQDILLVACQESEKKGGILLYSKAVWYEIFTSSESWYFPCSDRDFSTGINVLHVADFNLDSYPDVLLIMQDRDSIHKTVILYNDKCSSEKCSEFGRQLRFSLQLPNSDHSVSAAFYDFNMDGTLDIIISTEVNGVRDIKAYKNLIADDVTFLRVQVLSGFSEETLYGVNVPGPQVKYETTNTMGGAQCGALGQLSQSAHSSLQLPYVIFGLGRLANFVDRLTVSVPVPLIFDSSTPLMSSVDSTSLNLSASGLNATWPMLIPNSQMYVIPHPRAQPSSWKNKLLVTPSRNVVTTAVVLLSSCGALVIATLVLHWMEKREDKQEKIQEAYRFHFDAM